MEVSFVAADISGSGGRALHSETSAEVAAGMPREAVEDRDVGDSVGMTGEHNCVRLAAECDREFVHALFDQALSDHYDGDHVAHADRVLDTHLNGGVDRNGHFSLRQRMFVLTDGRNQLGLVHLVHKRQGTVKISPLIVHPMARRSGTGGRMLLDAAERFAREIGARQLYCTVAETNDSALGFFRHHGFVLAGSAFEQYKRGVCELILYKELRRSRERPGQGALTVRPLADADVPALSSLVLSAFDPVCEGLGADWVDALVAAYRRRHIADVNVKYKDVRVAVDGGGQVRGVAAAGPKKGGAVKVMPLCASDWAALSELLVWLPHYACPSGGRMYSHQPPDSVVSRVMQHHGWQVEALLPGAYHDDHCMVQWSLRVSPSSAQALC